MGVHYYIIPITTGDFTHTLHNMTFFQNTLRIHGRILWHIPVTTDDFITNAGHCRRLYTRFTQFYVGPRNTLKIHGRVLWQEPVTTDDFMTNTGHCRRLYTGLTQLCVRPRNTLKNTRSCTMTGTGHYRRLYNQYRSLPTTLYTFYTIMCEPSEYTKNTQSCTMTWTGHDRWLYKRLTLLLGLRSTGVGIWYNTHGRALPTVRILVPSSRRVSVWPNTIAQTISD